MVKIFLAIPIAILMTEIGYLLISFAKLVKAHDESNVKSSEEVSHFVSNIAAKQSDKTSKLYLTAPNIEYLIAFKSPRNKSFFMVDNSYFKDDMLLEIFTRDILYENIDNRKSNIIKNDISRIFYLQENDYTSGIENSTSYKKLPISLYYNDYKNWLKVEHGFNEHVENKEKNLWAIQNFTQK